MSSCPGVALLCGMNKMTTLRPVIVTGAAGFIGMHVCERLLVRGEQVVGIDSFTPYYDPALKHARLETLKHRPGFSFFEIDLADFAAVTRVFDEVSPDRVVHLAAQAGVRASAWSPTKRRRARTTRIRRSPGNPNASRRDRRSFPAGMRARRLRLT